MQNDFEIEIFDDEENVAEDIQLPLNFLSLGEVDSDDVKVYIKLSVYNKLEQYARTDTSVELGAMLVGEYTDHSGAPCVIISDYILAKYTDASSATLTFTHKTWEYVNEQMESKFKDKRIVGWQHTHPNYGIFLSNYDMFIHENYFNLPFQVAYVIDPVQNLRGFFQWKDSKVQKLKGYYVYDEVGKSIKLDIPKEQKGNESKADTTSVTKSGKPLIVLTVMLILLTVMLSALSLSLSSRIALQQEQITSLSEKLQEQQDTIVSQEQSISSLESQAESSLVIEEEHDKGKDKHDKVEFVAYTVKHGDTLYDILEGHGLQYGKYKNMVVSLNGISDPGAIYAGQVVLLPVM